MSREDAAIAPMTRTTPEMRNWIPIKIATTFSVSPGHTARVMPSPRLMSP